VFCDDLRIDEGEADYKALKSVLDGSVAAAAEILLICATSNRRHLLPEKIVDELAGTQGAHGETQAGEAVEEGISLAGRFGLWINFYPCHEDEYMATVAPWLRHIGRDEAAIAAPRPPALVWALVSCCKSARRFSLELLKDLFSGCDPLEWRGVDV
jgi:predicted AAA+ superfamily ATPase